MPEEQTLICERVGSVDVLRLNRPARKNALATPLLHEISDALARASADEAVRAAVITGNEKLFAAGADIDELADASSLDPIESSRFTTWATIRAFPKPLVAAVEGWCLGAGAELALCCDIVIAGDSAKFGQPETNLGIIPGAGGTATLTRLVGRALAMRMVLTGEPIDANTALRSGLIAEVCIAGQALERAIELASAIAARPPLAIQEAKASVREALNIGEQDHLRSERERFVSLLSTADKLEGINAFKAKRPPVWTGC